MDASTYKTIPESSIRYDGWRIVAVCFLLATFGWGLGFYGQSVYVAEQIVERGSRRDQRRRPAAQPLQLGNIDALAIEAEPPAEGCQQEAYGHDAPAVVTERGFVYSGEV